MLVWPGLPLATSHFELSSHMGPRWRTRTILLWCKPLRLFQLRALLACGWEVAYALNPRTVIPDLEPGSYAAV
jgi:hypothetical protein